jgi:hypothetical protein
LPSIKEAALFCQSFWSFGAKTMLRVLVGCVSCYAQKFFCSVCCCSGFSQKKVVMKKEERTIKIGSQFQKRAWHSVNVPFIRLSGQWLLENGFESGQQITVQAVGDQLIIKKKEQ